MTINHKSSGTAKAGLTTGIIGTSLGAVNLLGNGANAIGNLMNASAPRTWDAGCGGCGGDRYVDRYTLGLIQDNERLRADVALRDANEYTNGKLADVVSGFNERIRELEQQLCKQEVKNQATSDSFRMLGERVKSCFDSLDDKIRCECKERRCGDNSIVNYVNSTFYAKQVGTVTTGNPKVQQILYDPLPSDSGCCCG